ncbi:MAG: hypothetical protein P4N60_09540 [Verrucomicrobiae bacterium]|nr:hypothetical protein [Verrucomicrobiae bacterium]
MSKALFETAPVSRNLADKYLTFPLPDESYGIEVLKGLDIDGVIRADTLKTIAIPAA